MSISVNQLLGPDYDPHSGSRAIRREAAFYRWCDQGNDPLKFAAWLADGHSEDELVNEDNDSRKT